MKASHKVPEGKMVNIEIKENEGKVSEVKIRGDFFLEPAEKLEEIEESVEGLDINSGQEEIEKALEGVEAKMIGFSHSDIAKAFTKAVESENK